MRDRLLRIVSVGFSTIFLSHFSCPLAHAEKTPHLFSIQERLTPSLPIRQCYQPGSMVHQKLQGTILISSQDHRADVRPSLTHSASSPEEARDIDLQALFRKIREHFRSRGHPLTAELTLRDSQTVNAFAHDRDTVVITRALIQQTKSSSEIAFVMAHELAHLALGHDTHAGVRGELEADALALKVVVALGFDPCSGSSVLERLGSPAKLTLVSVSPRLTALHDKTFRFCG